MDIDIFLYTREETPPSHPVPFTLGLPLPRGEIADASELALVDNNGDTAAFQAEPVMFWPDGSVRWMTADFIAQEGLYYRFIRGRNATPQKISEPVAVREIDGGLVLYNRFVAVELKIKADCIKLFDASGVNEKEKENLNVNEKLNTNENINEKENINENEYQNDQSFTNICNRVAEIVSSVKIKNRALDEDIVSRAVIDGIETYASGPIRAAVSVSGRRIYSDGTEGPFSQRVELYAGSRHVKIEDTFVYSHLPGTHASPDNALSYWGLVCDKKMDARPLTDPEESEGLVISEYGAAFWGVETPFDLSRHTDEDLIGEDSPGIALGVAKSCAASFSFPSAEKNKTETAPASGAFAYVNRHAYESALADFSVSGDIKFDCVEEGVDQILGFWLYFQDNDPIGYDGKGPWYGLFDWGDWQTRYSSADAEPVGWQYREGRYGWDCGEMDTSLMLWNIFLHTGDEKYIRPAVAMARHAMDVDTIHVDYRDYPVPEYVYDQHRYDCPWREGADRLKAFDTRGLGRRHNVQHWGNGIGDTRHSFNAGVAMYYLLTGNRRARDCALSIADMHMRRIYGYASGEYGLAMECIYWAHKISGDKKYLAEFEYRLGVIRKLQLQDGSIPEHIDFDRQTDYSEVDGERGAHASLTLDYISNALAEYHSDTGSKDAAEVLIKLADCAHEKNPPNRGRSYPDLSDLRVLAWAYEHTGDMKFYDRLFYLVFTLAAQPFDKRPENAEDWVRLTYNVMWRQRWRIRHIGPGVRMVPYALKALGQITRPPAR